MILDVAGSLDHQAYARTRPHTCHQLKAEEALSRRCCALSCYTLLNFVTLANRMAENGMNKPRRSCTIRSSPS